MTWLLPQGESLMFEGLDQPLHIVRGIGGGTQGQVYSVELGQPGIGEQLALKWYLPGCIARDPQLRNRLSQSIRLGAPNSDFLWPMALLEPLESQQRGFGYLMALRPEGFVGANLHAGGALEISLQNVLKACFHLAEAFHQLHLKGLCYKDISLGNLFLAAHSGRILICDNDNVDIDGKSRGSVLGTPGFMAPEVLLGQSRPGTSSDLFSLAVLLFRLLTRHDPFRGARELAVRCLDEPARRRLYGEEALFIFDPDDAANRPDPIEHSAPLITWPIYPRGLQQLFELSFGAGLRQPEERALTGQWKQALARCLDQRQLCHHCGQEVFADLDSSNCCWNCGSALQQPMELQLPRGRVVAAAGNAVQPHHFNLLAGEAIDLPLAEFVPHPSDPQLLGLKNLSDYSWQGVLIDGRRITLEPGKSFNFAALQQVESHTGAMLVMRP
ncbi:protein kinase [Synechococcus sp. AH-601-C19]|nr:protein kinase [Synechococcus sp. AH-601-C19]